MITFGETIPKMYNTWGHGVILNNLGGWWVGGRGWERVPDLVTPSVIHFWNRLNKCNHILKEKVKKIIIGKIFFWILLVRVRKVICQREGVKWLESKIFFHKNVS